MSVYRFTNGRTMKREGECLYWHLRDREDNLIDSDKYRHDLFSRHDLDHEARTQEDEIGRPRG